MLVVDNRTFAANAAQVITRVWNHVLEPDNLRSWRREIAWDFCYKRRSIRSKYISANGPSLRTISRVSNLKYESVRIDFKAVVFIRANPGKKETTDRSGPHVNFIQKQCTFPEVVSPKKWYVTNIKSWA